MSDYITAYNFLNTKFKEAEFTGEWAASFGKPELSGLWFIWGRSGSGKTSLAWLLCKYLSGFGRIVYNSLEQGVSLSSQKAAVRAGVKLTDKRILLLKKTPIDKLEILLKRHKSPNLIVIDSIQRFKVNYKEFTAFIDQFPNKLFIVISQAQGTEPKGATADGLRFDADVKIYVEGHRAFFDTRFADPDTGLGGEDFVIWEKGDERYRAKQLEYGKNYRNL